MRFAEARRRCSSAFVRRALLVVLGASALVACSAAEQSGADTTVESATEDMATSDAATPDADSPDADGPEEGAVEDEADGATQQATVQGLPDTPAGRQFEAVLTGALSGSLAEEELEMRMSEAFIEQVSPASFITMSQPLPGLLGLSPVVSRLEIASDYALAGTLLNPTDSSEWSFFTSVQIDEPHRVLSMAIAPIQTPEPDASIADLEAAATAWSELGTRTDLLVAEVDPSDPAGAEAACGAGLPGVGGDGLPSPIGSAFKLYVLGAVATAVEDGRLSWTDELTITDEVKSLPSGQLQIEAAGTSIDVAAAATLMLAVSDNTATDLLIEAVGREAVEAELAVGQHHNPSLNQPFLTTRALFQLKLGDPVRLGLYQAGDEATRRQLLADLSTEPLPALGIDAFTEPTAIDVEWLATTEDLCRILLLLNARGEQHPELLTALQAGRGPLGNRAWPEVAFKGGSEPGVLSLHWLAVRSDGRAFVVSANASNPDAIIDDQAAMSIALRIFDLLQDL